MMQTTKSHLLDAILANPIFSTNSDIFATRKGNAIVTQQNKLIKNDNIVTPL